MLYRLSYRGNQGLSSSCYPNCHPIATRLWSPLFALRTDRFSFRPDLGEGRFHDFGGAAVGILEQVAVDVKGDGRRRMSDPTRHCEHVEAGSNKLADVGVAQAMQRAVEFQGGHRLREFLRQPVRRSELAIPAGEDEGIFRRLSQAER